MGIRTSLWIRYIKTVGVGISSLEYDKFVKTSRLRDSFLKVDKVEI